MKKQYRVVITDFVRDNLETERRILGDIAEIEALDGYKEDDIIGRIEDADAVMVYHHFDVTRKTIERLQHCKLIVRCGVGYDNIDWRYAAERGIPVANVPDYGTEDVADTAIGMMMAMARGITYLNSRLRANAGPWHYSQVVPIYRFRGRILGIIGLGRIGSAAALRGKALGMDVVCYDPYKSDGYEKSLGIRRVEHLDELLAQSHIVSLHCPLNDETRHLISAEAIAKMPKGAYLVNTARGAIVDHLAIPAAIESGQLAGAGIDVLPQEPPRDDDPLVVAWRNPEHPAHHRVLLNPHSAFYCEEGFNDMRTKGSNACRRAFSGQSLRNVVNGVGG
jgi:D-3-phosphoglycerate dehydrogenase/C-terminal binding protein